MDIVLKSLGAAIITALILIVVKVSGPRLGGALGGVPIVFAVSYILVTMQNRGLAKEFLVGGVLGALSAIFFCLLLIFLNYLSPRSFWLNFALSYLLCLGLAFVLASFHFPHVT